MDPSTYGERIADVYDEWYEGATDVAGTVATVARLAEGEPVLELGIGTGRLALPMAEAGLVVHGIDASPAMVERLRARPGGGSVPVTIADYADVPVPDPNVAYGVVLLAFNALLTLTTEDAQVACLRRCGDVGRLVVVETFVPAEDAPPDAVEVRHVSADEVRLSAYRIDDGVVSGSVVSITEAGIRLRPWTVRLMTPAQIDAVADAAGLVVVDRWAGWNREPFDDSSDRSVTVYRRR